MNAAAAAAPWRGVNSGGTASPALRRKRPVRGA